MPNNQIEFDQKSRIEFALSSMKTREIEERRGIPRSAVGAAITAGRLLGGKAISPLRHGNETSPTLPHPREIKNRLEGHRIFVAETLLGGTASAVLAQDTLGGMTRDVLGKLYKNDEGEIRPARLAVGSLIPQIRQRPRARGMTAGLVETFNVIRSRTGIEVRAFPLGEPIVARPGDSLTALGGVAAKLMDFRDNDPDVIVLLSDPEEAEMTLHNDPGVGHAGPVDTKPLWAEIGAVSDGRPVVPAG